MPVLGGLTLLRYLSSPGENPKRPNCLLPPACPLVHEGSSWEGTSRFFCASPGGTGQCLHALDRPLPVPQGCCLLFVHAAHILVNQLTPLLHRKQTNNKTTTKKQQIKWFPPNSFQTCICIYICFVRAPSRIKSCWCFQMCPHIAYC